MASSSDNTNTKSPIEKYPYPTEFNVLDFVPKLLGQANYEKWKKLMRDFIESRGLIDFIDGTAQEENANKDCDEARKRLNNLVQGWILATITEEIRLELRDSITAKDLWEELEENFDPTSPSSSNNNAKSPIEKYPYPTEFNVLDFVPKLLGQANYEKWKDLMRDFIERRGLIGFIDGTAKEENTKEDCDEARKRSDNLVQGWILATLTEDIRLEVCYLRTARNLWKELEENFDPTSPSSSNNNAKSPIEKYPYPTEFNVLDFVPKLLGEANYEKWKDLMRDFIERRGLIGFIDGTAKEEIGNQDYYKAWKRSGNLVQAWILATITEDIRLQLRDSITAKDLWEELSRKFDLTSPFWPSDAETENRMKQYLPLHKATIKGDWEEASGIIKQDPDAVRTPITQLGEAALHVAINSKGRNHFVKNLLEKMTPQEVVSLVDEEGHTALHYAACSGNIEGARMLVNKNPELPNVVDKDGDLPLQCAASWGHREMVLYLREVTSEDTTLATGHELLRDLTKGELYDMALSLLQRKPKLACMEPDKKKACMEPNPLGIIVEKYSSFKSGNSFNFWQNLIYLGLPKKSRSIENPPKCCISVRQRLHFMFWRVAENLVPCIKRIREIKEKQHHARELVKILCMEIAKSNPSEVEKIFQPVMRRATYYGVPEIVEEIIVSYPVAMNMKVQDNLSMLQYAIQCRREHVFNLVYQLDNHSIFIARLDNSRNNGLHLAASLKHEQQIIVRASAAGPVLQMQRELQWFKEVEKFATPGDMEARNNDGMTPAEVFSETHQNLVKDGERWMKDTATSCTIVAALIATMVFAAAITVPGGNNSYNGHPVLSKQKAFVIFGISDALALFSSITSVLMFLLILTSRYAEKDFLHTLPNRLVIGLITLFVSILSMMVAFGAILYLVFGDNQEWVLIPIIALASIPATLFGALQLPLLVEMIQSTYGRSIFGKQSDRVLG